MLNTEKVEFTISESAEGKPESTDAGTAVNYKGSVRLTKVDAEGKKLEGAVFKIVDSDGKTVKEDLVSDKDGKVETSGLAPGHYAFIETKAPDGYVLNTEKKSLPSQKQRKESRSQLTQERPSTIKALSS